MSASSNRGPQHQVGEHVEGDRQVLVQHFRVEAGHFLRREGVEHPARESIDCAISSAVRRSVPLNTMCSMKCAIPLLSGDSPREPVPTQMPTDTGTHVRHFFGHHDEAVRQLRAFDIAYWLVHFTILA